MDEWISVNDRLPDEEKDVLVLMQEVEFYGRHKEKRSVYHSIYVGWQIEGEWATVYCYGHKELADTQKENPNERLRVSHWMPLPKMPNKEVIQNKE